MKQNKKAVSELVTYVLLISLAVAMAGATYGWLKFYVQKPFPEQSCPDVSLIIMDYKCSNAMLNLTVQNRGRFDVDGYIIKINNGSDEYPLRDRRYPLSYVPFRMGPGNSTVGEFNFSVFRKIDSIELEAVRGFDRYGHPILCENSVVRQKIQNCPYGSAAEQPTASCGDRQVNPPEQCDGTNLNGSTCASVKGPGSIGTLRCTLSCQFDISGCSGAV